MLAEFMFTFMKLNKVNPDLSLSATRVKIIEYQDDGEESEFVEGEEQNEEEANEQVGVEQDMQQKVESEDEVDVDEVDKKSKEVDV